MGYPNVEYVENKDRGYCSSIKPKLNKNINKGNIVLL